MFNFIGYVHLRYVLLINAMAALAPATSVKGRENDPLLGASWWTFNLHSAVLAVALGALLGSAVVLAAVRKNLRGLWVFVGCGIVAGVFPATFYLAAAPRGAQVPFGDMYLSGMVSGVIAGVVLNMVLGGGGKAKSMV